MYETGRTTYYLQQGKLIMKSNQMVKSGSVGNWLASETEETLNHYGIPSINHNEIDENFGEMISKNNCPGFFIKNISDDSVLQLKSFGAIKIVDGSNFVEEDISKFLCDCVSMKEVRIIILIPSNSMPNKSKKWVKYSASSVMRKDVRVMEITDLDNWLYDVINK